MRTVSFLALVAFAALALGADGCGLVSARQTPSGPPLTPLVTGKLLTPAGDSVPVGSYPTSARLSPDGRFVAVSGLGARSFLTIVDAASGQAVSRLGFNGPHPTAANKKSGLYVGLAFAPDSRTLYVSRGTDNLVSALAISPDGAVTDTKRTFAAPAAAGLAISDDGATLCAASSAADPKNGMNGSVILIDTASGAATKLPAPGYTFAATYTGGLFFVSSEQRGCVLAIDPASKKELWRVDTGAQPIALLSSLDGKTLFVANAGSDTVSAVDIAARRVTKTYLLRPADARSIPLATPTGLALSPDGHTLYASLGDLNAVAVIDVLAGKVAGYIPAGWYPTGVAVSRDGRRLFVASAKGTVERTPNKVAPVVAERSRYIQNVLEGTLSTVDIAAARSRISAHTDRVLQNNHIRRDLLANARRALRNPGIEYVVYIVKENRTYDQVLGDNPRGNGDSSLTLFGRDVTPNLHALADRFVLLDNFYCCAEVSGDGWSFSTQGMASEYASRNVPYGYTGKVRSYDYEGSNNGVPVDRLGIADVARAPGGYIWDKANEKRVSLRNYGMFTDDFDLPRENAEEGAAGKHNTPNKKALVGVTCEDFRQFDLTFADSEAWMKHALTPAPKQRAKSGRFDDGSRITTWRREYEQFVKSGKMPRLMLLRLGRDHTSGTAAGASTPRAMVADNDFAIGQLVETISHGPLWKKTAILVVEDDAQNGFDHVDAHRSIAFVISPFVPEGLKDSRFFNTDSVLHTIECLLNLDPMTLYDATAPALAVFGAAPANNAPYVAILPEKAIVGEVNKATAYRATDSARLLNPTREESAPDEELNDILWHSIKGINVPAPDRVYALNRAPLPDADNDDEKRDHRAAARTRSGRRDN